PDLALIVPSLPTGTSMLAPPLPELFTSVPPDSIEMGLEADPPIPKFPCRSMVPPAWMLRVPDRPADPGLTRFRRPPESTVVRLEPPIPAWPQLTTPSIVTLAFPMRLPP